METGMLRKTRMAASAAELSVSASEDKLSI